MGGRAGSRTLHVTVLALQVSAAALGVRRQCGSSQTLRVTLPAFTHEAQARTRVGVPSTTVRTVWMFGFQRRLVRRWEWEILLPNPGPLPQTSQVAAMGDSIPRGPRRAVARGFRVGRVGQHRLHRPGYPACVTRIGGDRINPRKAIAPIHR